MNFEEVCLKGCYLITPEIYTDCRGDFFENYNYDMFYGSIKDFRPFVQENISISSYGVIRGLHFQKDIFAQAKLVTCLNGKIWDIAVDLRRESVTFGKWFGVYLCSSSRRQIYIPRGFAHGFAVISDTAEVMYKCDNKYNRSSEGGIIWNDFDLKIDWKLPDIDVNLSDKDKRQKPFKEFLQN